VGKPRSPTDPVRSGQGPKPQLLVDCVKSNLWDTVEGVAHRIRDSDTAPMEGVLTRANFRIRSTEHVSPCASGAVLGVPETFDPELPMNSGTRSIRDAILYLLITR